MKLKRDNAEHGLSHWVDAFLGRVLLGNCWYTAIEGGTWLRSLSPEARMNAEAKRKARGIKPAHLDWYAWQESTGIYAQWELKVNGRPERSGQKQTATLLRRNNIPTAVCETVPQVCEFLAGAGFALHGNAANIALELHERYLANRREHKAKKPARSAGRTSARGNVSVKQAHALGLWK